ncbi:MAG: hypothetical protein GY946_01350, partial [bacterium]|nr:hypothetical protein [bacterium]
MFVVRPGLPERLHSRHGERGQRVSASSRLSDRAIAPQATPTNVLVVGVGGQGVVMVSRVLAKLCERNGLDIKQSEVHGMAKRGGVVFSHVRFGERVYSPTIPEGEADIVLAMEWAEGLRWLPFLKRESGGLIADTQRIVPPFSCRNRKRGALHGYQTMGLEELEEVVARVVAVDATGVASEVGNRRAANTVLLGVLSSMLDFDPSEWREVVAEVVPPKTIEANLLGFERGREWALQETRAELPTPPEPERPTHAADRVELEIVEAWCKGCDICVKVCPERCLELNGSQVAVLRDPAACSGCRVCEWLCPALAIHVRILPAPEQ